MHAEKAFAKKNWLMQKQKSLKMNGKKCICFSCQIQYVNPSIWRYTVQLAFKLDTRSNLITSTIFHIKIKATDICCMSSIFVPFSVMNSKYSSGLHPYLNLSFQTDRYNVWMMITFFLRPPWVQPVAYITIFE